MTHSGPRPWFLPLIFLLCAGCDGITDSLTRIDAVAQQAEYAVPLVDSRVGLPALVGQLDERVDIRTGDDGLLRFIYRDTVPPVTSEEVFAQLRDIGRALPFGLDERSTTLPFPNPPGVQVRELRTKGGTLSYSFPNTYDRPVDIVFTLENATRAGSPLTIGGSLPAHDGTGEPPVLTNVDAPLDFSGYVLDLASPLRFTYEIDDATDGTPLEPPARTVAVFNDLDFSYVSGTFGATPYPGVSGRLEIDFFEQYRGGEISFVDPLIRVRVRNSFGLPARALVEELDITTVDGRTVDVTGQVVEEGFDFDYPRAEGSTVATTYFVDEQNSNLGELIAARPIALNYRISAIVNPDDENLVGFLADTSTYVAILEVELPLFGAASNFRVVDSFPIHLGRDYGELTAASLRITTDNGLPFDLTLEGTFYDSLGTALLDLAGGELLPVRAAPVDADGLPAGTTTATTDVDFPPDRLAALRRADYLLLTAGFATAEGGARDVRVTADQELRVRIGARLSVDNL